MADPENGAKTGGKPGGQKGLSMERRMLLAFLLMGLVLMLTPYFYRSSSPSSKAPVKPAASQDSPVAPSAKPPVEQATAESEAPPPAVPAGQVGAEKEETYIVETDLSRIVFSNKGAVVRSWILKKYKDGSRKPLDLVHTAGAARAGYPFSLVFKGKVAADLMQVLYAAKTTSDGLGVDFEFSSGRLWSRKSFRFRKDSYLADVSSEATQDGKSLPHYIAWRGGFGDGTVPNHPATEHTLHFDVTANKLIVKEAKAASDGPLSAIGTFSFAGIEDQYFAAVFLPASGVSTEVFTYQDHVAGEQKDKEVPHIGMSVGGSGANRLPIFVGPKDIDILRKVNPKLEQVVDFGWFSFLAKPLFLAVNWVNDRWVQNYGWSIVVVTIIINFMLLPLKFTSLKSMKKMQMLQPQIAAINEKYKGIGIRDPRKADQNQEVMELYKRHGVNPMGGCVPMLLQIPFFIAFYKVLTVAIEMRGASWLWVSDLSQPETLPIRILPIAMIVSQFIMQKMTPSTTADPSQQRIMLMMPLILGFMFYGVSSGLVLYWLTGNVVGIAQQWFFNKTSVAPVPPPPPVKQAKKGAKK